VNVANAPDRPAAAAAAPAATTKHGARSVWSRRPSRTRLQRAALWVIVTLAIALLSWQTVPLTPQAGLDSSWQAALQMAITHGITFGNRLIFTYGPLGFLSFPTLWYTHTGAIAFGYTVLWRILLVVALLSAARRTYGAVAGALVALLIAGASASTSAITSTSTTGNTTFVTVPFLIFAVLVVDGVRDRRRLAALMALAGATAGVMLLNETSVGIELAALALIMAYTAKGNRVRHLLIVAGALVAALLAAWTAAGQDWGALPSYIRGSEQIVAGYAAAMGYEQAGLGWQYPAAWIAFAFGLAGALEMTAGGDSRRRWGIVGLWVAFCFFEFKEAFVRHDLPHGIIYFLAVMGGIVAFRWRPEHRLAALGLTAALFALTMAAGANSFAGVFNPGGDASSAIDQIGQVLQRSERERVITTGRDQVRAEDPIDPTTLSLLHGHTVDVLPDDVAAAWAYGLDWRPLPVFQSYAVYTTALDEDDADALRSNYAPQRILRNRDPAIDDRVLAFDEPLTARTILCRYRQLRATLGWQVLAREPSRCGASRLIGVVHAQWDESVPIPAPPNGHSLVYVRIYGVQVGGLERLTSLIDKPVERDVILDSVPYRLVEGTAADGLLLRAAPAADYPVPWNFAPDDTTIGVMAAGRSQTVGTPITFAFYEESLR
jgi:hypothetical protein